MSEQFDSNVNRWIMRFMAGNYESPVEVKKFLLAFAEEVRSDERMKVSGFLESLGSKFMLEFQAYRDFLEDKSADSPDQIHLELN